MFTGRTGKVLAGNEPIVIDRPSEMKIISYHIYTTVKHT